MSRWNRRARRAKGLKAVWYKLHQQRRARALYSYMLFLEKVALIYGDGDGIL